MLSSAVSVTSPVACAVVIWPIVIEPETSLRLMSPEVDVAFNVPGLGLVGVAPLVMERRNGSLAPMPWAAVRVMSWPPTADESFSSAMAPFGC